VVRVKINSIDYPIVKVNNVVPFRVKFTTIGLPSTLGTSIGIAVIGSSFVIL